MAAWLRACQTRATAGYEVIVVHYRRANQVLQHRILQPLPPWQVAQRVRGPAFGKAKKILRRLHGGHW